MNAAEWSFDVHLLGFTVIGFVGVDTATEQQEREKKEDDGKTLTELAHWMHVDLLRR
jgi:hypothetical protein